MSFIKCSDAVPASLLSDKTCHVKSNTINITLPLWARESLKFLYSRGVEVVSINANGFYTESGMLEVDSMNLGIKSSKDGQVVNAVINKHNTFY